MLTNRLTIALVMIGVILGLWTLVVWGDDSDLLSFCKSSLYCVFVASLPMYLLAAAMKKIARSSVSKILLVAAAVAVACLHVESLCNPSVPSSDALAGLALIVGPLVLGTGVCVVILIVALIEKILMYLR